MTNHFDHSPQIADALGRALSFVEGFEDDELQEGIPELIGSLSAARDAVERGPWHALECAQFWLQEEAASEHHGEARPDDILRVIGDALAGRPMAPLTSDLVKPDLASQLRFLGGIIGTDSQQGRNEARQMVAYVEGVAAQLLAALKELSADVRELEGYWTEGTEDVLSMADSAIARAEGKEG